VQYQWEYNYWICNLKTYPTEELHVVRLLTLATGANVLHHMAQLFLQWCQTLSTKNDTYKSTFNCHSHYIILRTVPATYSENNAIKTLMGREMIRFLFQFFTRHSCKAMFNSPKHFVFLARHSYLQSTSTWCALNYTFFPSQSHIPAACFKSWFPNYSRQSGLPCCLHDGTFCWMVNCYMKLLHIPSIQ
jgi:hypothetical protein